MVSVTLGIMYRHCTGPRTVWLVRRPRFYSTSHFLRAALLLNTSECRGSVISAEFWDLKADFQNSELVPAPLPVRSDMPRRH